MSRVLLMCPDTWLLTGQWHAHVSGVCCASNTDNRPMPAPRHAPPRRSVHRGAGGDGLPLLLGAEVLHADGESGPASLTPHTTDPPLSTQLNVLELNQQPQEIVDHLYVNSSRDTRLLFNFNMTFPKLSCSLLSADALDPLGNKQVGGEARAQLSQLYHITTSPPRTRPLRSAH